MSARGVWIAFGFFAATLIVGMFAARFSPSYQECETYGAKYASQDEAGNTRYLVAQPHPADSTFIDCESFFADTNGSAITALATVLLGVVTGGLVWLGWLQLLTTRTQLRAQVFPVNFLQWWTADTPVNGQYSWHFRPQWQNSGETAAEDMVVFVECEIRNSMLPPGFDFNAALAGQQEWPGLLPPKMTLQGGLAPHNSGITPQDILDVQAGRKFLYLYGRVEYADVFPATKDHLTHFCWRILAVGDPVTFAPNDPNHTLSFNYLLHSEGNYTEDV